LKQSSIPTQLRRAKHYAHSKTNDTTSFRRENHGLLNVIDTSPNTFEYIQYKFKK